MTENMLSLAERNYARVRTRLILTGAVGKFFEELAGKGDITQAELARRLGVSRSRISRLLKSPGNWTVDTIGDLLKGMDARISSVEIRRESDIAKPNEFHEFLERDVASTVALNAPGQAYANRTAASGARLEVRSR